MSTPQTPPVSKKATIIGWILSILPSLLLVFSAVMKFAKPAGMAEGFAHLQIPLSMAGGLGVLELACTVIYLIPRTAVLGAILLTGYLGGAILTHLRVGDPYFVQGLLGVVLWGGVYLRDPRLRALIPFRS
ncbi:MAG: Arginine/ornithine antiporter ArcD [Verrucomicrobia bacterium]|nr:Arginine/ornithine antiporter ArcD [Verrucomicrobiota bacterium]